VRRFPLAFFRPLAHHDPVTTCVFCGTTADRLTDEHAIPKWARDAFNIQGPITITARDSPGRAPKRIGRLPHLNIVLRQQLCHRCNNEWLARLETAVQPILTPIALRTEPHVQLDPAAQKLLAFWAVKTTFMVELAIHQNYQGRRTVQGYLPTQLELAWMRTRGEPPPRSMVWLGAWDCQQEIPVHYEPSSAPLPTQDGTPVTGHLATLTLGYAAFQVFTVDFLAAEHHGAPLWNTHVPPSLAPALIRIWPQQLIPRDITWPPEAFGRQDWRRLITWDGKLRPDEPIPQLLS
jgi:hypothetical protein